MYSILVLVMIVILIFAIILVTSFHSQKRNIVKNEHSNTKVVIIGGGLTGLILANQLTKHNIPFRIIEANPHIGGRILTVKYNDGETSESPLEEFWQFSPCVDLLKELGVPMESSTAHSSIRYNNKIFIGKGDPNFTTYTNNMFTEPNERLAFIAWNEKMCRLWTDLAKSHYKERTSNDGSSIGKWNSALLAPYLRPLMNISFAEFVKSDNLPRKVEEWIRITLEPEIASEWENIAALDGIDEFRIFLCRPDGTFGESAYHLPKGNSSFITALGKSLPPKSIDFGCTVTQITHEDDSVKITYLEESYGTVDRESVKTITAEIAVVTVPLHALQHIRFHPPLDRTRQRAIDTVAWGSYIKIHLRVKREAEALWKTKYGDDLFVLLTDDISGCIYNSTHQLCSKDGECTDFVITLLLHGKFAKSVMEFSDDEIQNAAIRRVDELFPTLSKYISVVEVFVFTKSVAYWPIHLGRSRFDELSDLLRSPIMDGRVFIGGDSCFGSHSEGAAISALCIANQLVSRFT
jgi:monoamine oxidase